MFTFTCYGCGALFHDGLPPLEALSDQQASFVMDVDTPEALERELKSRSLVGTRFEGLSSAGICEFCLLWVHEFPSVTKNKYNFTETKKAIECCWTDLHLDVDPATNRRMVLLEAMDIYPNHPLLDMLRQLHFVGIELIEATCQFPTCGKSLDYWTYPQKITNVTVCRDHDYRLRFDPIWFLYRFHLAFNPLHNYEDNEYMEWLPKGDGTFKPPCKICWDAYLDDWDAQREAYEQERWEAQYDPSEFSYSDPDEYITEEN